MAILSAREIAWLVRNAGGSDPTAVAVALAESGGNTAALHADIGSYDRGLWQINSKYHPEVSDSCAFSATCSTTAAKTISNNWTDFSPWSSYTFGGYQAYMPVATSAMANPQAPDNAVQAATLAQPAAVIKKGRQTSPKPASTDHTPSGSPFPGGQWDPLNWGADIANIFQGNIGNVEHTLIEVMVRGAEILAGAALFGVGLAMFVYMLARESEVGQEAGAAVKKAGEVAGEAAAAAALA